MVLVGLAAPGLLHAEEEQVYFSSDYQQEIQDEQVLILQGNVEVHFRDIIIYADEVRLNDEKDEFFGVGNIHLVAPDRDIFSDSIWYDYANDDFDMRNARGSMLVQSVGELVWFEAERLKGNINDYKMINGRVTTCTPTEHREYHIEARSIKILPGNKIIFRNGYIFILNIPVLWFPFWSYSIAETPWVIDVGKRAGDGVYINSRYNYLAEELIIGALLFNYYSLRGYQFGAEHQYVLPRHGQGSINWSYSYSTLRDQQTGEVRHANEYRVTMSQNYRFGPRAAGRFSLTTSSDVSSSGRTNRTNGSLSWGYTTASTRTNVSVNASETTGVSQQGNLNTSLTHNRNLWDDVAGNFKIDYTVNNQVGGGAADEDFKAHLEISQRYTGWNWVARVDSHWDPDGYTYTGDRSRGYTDKLPEIDITFQQNAFPGEFRDLLGFQMQSLKLRGALYYIGPESKEVNGFFGRLETGFTRTFQFGPSHRVQTTINYFQAIASTGDARFTYSTQANWTWDISNKLKWDLRWNRSDNEGRIPFTGMGGSGTPSNRMNWSLAYTNGRLYTIKLQTGYELRDAYNPVLWTIDRMSDLGINFTYNPSTRIRETLGTGLWFLTEILQVFCIKLTCTDLV